MNAGLLVRTLTILVAFIVMLGSASDQTFKTDAESPQNMTIKALSELPRMIP